MDIVINILFLLVSLIVFLTYRQGIKDGAQINKNNKISPVFNLKKEGKLSDEEQDLISQYNEILNYDFDKAGEKNGL